MLLAEAILFYSCREATIYLNSKVREVCLLTKLVTHLDCHWVTGSARSRQYSNSVCIVSIAAYVLLLDVPCNCHWNGTVYRWKTKCVQWTSVRRPDNVGSNFWKQACPKNWRNWRDINNFRIWPRISLKRIEKTKFGIAVGHLQPLLCWAKK